MKKKIIQVEMNTQGFSNPPHDGIYAISAPILLQVASFLGQLPDIRRIAYFP